MIQSLAINSFSYPKFLTFTDVYHHIIEFKKMEITNDLILKLENLAKLKLSDIEREKLKSELGRIIDMFGEISEVNTENVLPLIHMTETYNSLRQDKIGKQLTLEEVEANAPKIIQKMFAVPKVIE